MKQKHIGLFGGSFDPIHLGHLNLALSILELRNLDEVWLCPTAFNPLKPQGCRASAEDRLEMIRLAIEDVPALKLVNIEIFKRGPSFTVDTLKQLSEIQKNEGRADRFSLIIGEDVARTFYQWLMPEEIIKYAQIFIGGRAGYFSDNEFLGSEPVVQALKLGKTEVRVMEISSTEIRSRIANYLYCGHLLPRKVLDYIIEHRLYC